MVRKYVQEGAGFFLGAGGKYFFFMPRLGQLGLLSCFAKEAEYLHAWSWGRTLYLCITFSPYTSLSHFPHSLYREFQAILTSFLIYGRGAPLILPTAEWGHVLFVTSALIVSYCKTKKNKLVSRIPMIPYDYALKTDLSEHNKH